MRLRGTAAPVAGSAAASIWALVVCGRFTAWRVGISDPEPWRHGYSGLPVCPLLKFLFSFSQYVSPLERGLRPSRRSRLTPADALCTCLGPVLPAWPRPPSPYALRGSSPTPRTLRLFPPRPGDAATRAAHFSWPFVPCSCAHSRLRIVTTRLAATLSAPDAPLPPLRVNAAAASARASPREEAAAAAVAGEMMKGLTAGGTTRRQAALVLRSPPQRLRSRRQADVKQRKRERQEAAAARKQAKAANAAGANARRSDDDDDDDDDGLSPSRPRRRHRMSTSMSSIGSRDDPIALDSDMSDC